MPTLRQSAARLPWRAGNRFRLIESSDRYLQRMIQAIDDARSHVLLEMYLIESGTVAGRFIESLTAAARRGVGVHLSADGFGSLGLVQADRRRLADSGVELRWYNPIRWRKRLHNFVRDHRKILVVDGRVAFVGGVGLTDEFGLFGPPGWPWRDLVVEIHGPVVADWQRAFGQTWRRTGGEPSFPQAPEELPSSEGLERSPLAVRVGGSPSAESPKASPPTEPLAGSSLGRPLTGSRSLDRPDAAVGAVSSEDARGRVVLSETWHRSELANAVARRIVAARQRVWIMSAYFVPSRRFRRALRRAARQGVDVRLLVPGPLTDHPWVRYAARRFYGKLLRNGVRIFEYQSRMLHAKMTLCDDWVSIGSSNLDRWSFKWNLEANQEIDDGPFAKAAAEVFESDCALSLELDRRRWPQRARLDRIRESVAGAFDRWLERWRRPNAR